MTDTPVPTPTVAPVVIAPGYKTTEFWKSLVVTVFGLIMASGVILPNSPYSQIMGMIAAAITAANYGQARSNVKAAAIASSQNTDGGN